MSSEVFAGVVLDPTAHGVLLSNSGKYAQSVLLMGIFGIVAGVLIFFTSDGREDRTISVYLVSAGAAVASIGFVARKIIHSREISRASEPRELQGLVVSGGKTAWGKCSARFGVASKDGSIAVADFYAFECSPSDSRQSVVRIMIASLGGDRLHHIGGIGFYLGREFIGEVIKDESGVFYLMTGSPAQRAIPLDLASDAESGDVSRTCVRNLRHIGNALSRCQDLRVRLAIAFPKEGVIKWGLALGLVGGLIATGLEQRSKNKLQRLLEEGGLHDSEGSLLELADTLGWEIELV